MKLPLSSSEQELIKVQTLNGIVGSQLVLAFQLHDIKNITDAISLTKPR